MTDKEYYDFKQKVLESKIFRPKTAKYYSHVSGIEFLPESIATDRLRLHQISYIVEVIKVSIIKPRKFSVADSECIMYFYEKNTTNYSEEDVNYYFEMKDLTKNITLRIFPKKLDSRKKVDSAFIILDNYNYVIEISEWNINSISKDEIHNAGSLNHELAHFLDEAYSESFNKYKDKRKNFEDMMKKHLKNGSKIEYKKKYMKYGNETNARFHEVMSDFQKEYENNPGLYNELIKEEDMIDGFVRKLVHRISPLGIDFLHEYDIKLKELNLSKAEMLELKKIDQRIFNRAKKEFISIIKEPHFELDEYLCKLEEEIKRDNEERRKLFAEKLGEEKADLLMESFKHYSY